jgi:ectoine hydroxylase-related dioxygenase (phytanoyl-CoA dioxygenase family)
MRLTNEQQAAYRAAGHLTVPGVFNAAEMDAVLADLDAWGRQFLAALAPEQRRWYVDAGVAEATALRKLDNPAFHRPAFRRLASHPNLVGLVEQLIGPGVTVYFSQIFMKPARGGGPKPVHQDNFYFGPDDPDGIVTAWIALDEATIENGCLYFGEGTNRGPVYPHVAPADRPFDLQLPDEIARNHPMTPAPVPRGGVSFHHGNTLHQSSDNRSDRPRRACALHYVRNDVVFATPALDYDKSIVVRIS